MNADSKKPVHPLDYRNDSKSYLRNLRNLWMSFPRNLPGLFAAMQVGMLCFVLRAIVTAAAG